MDEKTFIYQRLKYLTDENERMLKLIEQVSDVQAKQMNIIENLVDKINEIGSTDYYKKQKAYSDFEDITNKIKFMRGIVNK
ncbi:hypothetical protein CHH83_01800 [Bacillus sp. 7586-K]|nr:hypothetical protein CHH83_01800 [Bacillus sp. 7586-K]